MLQSLSDAFLSQFQRDEGQALTIVSESMTSQLEIRIPFVLDNSLGRDTNIFVSWPDDKVRDFIIWNKWEQMFSSSENVFELSGLFKQIFLTNHWETKKILNNIFQKKISNLFSTKKLNVTINY